MVGARGVPWLVAQRVHGDAQTSVFVMVVEKGVNMKDVLRVPKEAPTSARHMGEANDAPGNKWDLSLVVKLLFRVISLLGENLAFVLPTLPRCKKNLFMVMVF